MSVIPSLSGVNRSSAKRPVSVAIDPKRTSVRQFAQPSQRSNGARAADFICGDMRAGQIEDRCLNAESTSPAHHVAQDVFALGGRTPLDVSEHRPFHRRSHGGDQGRVEFDKGGSGFEAGGGSDGAALVENFEHRLSTARCGEDVANTGAHQTGYPGTEAQLHELLPDVLHHRFTGPSIKAGAAETGVERVRPVAEAAKDFTEHEIVVGNKLDDPALGIHTSADIRHTAQYVACAEPRNEPVEMSHAVEYRQDHGVRPNRRSELVHGFVE